MPSRASSPRLVARLLAEFLGAGLLVAVVVGSGIAAQRLSTDVGLQLLENSTATVLGLLALIVMFGPVSGAHLNPVVTIADWALGRRSGSGIAGAHAAGYVAAQMVGAIGGCLLADAMFEEPIAWSTTDRLGGGHLLGEVVATAGLVLLVFSLVRTERAVLAAPAVAAYIGAAYWFTSSTSFANPAVTVGRMLTDTFAGIAPASAPAFIAMQFVGLVVGAGLVLILFPGATRHADEVVIPHPSDPQEAHR